MSIGMDVSAIGQVAGADAEPPRSVAEQIEQVFAQQLVAALSEHEKHRDGEEGASYLGLLSGPLAQEIAKTGALGIGQQLNLENSP